MEPPKGIIPKRGVLIDAGCDERVRGLQQDRGRAAESDEELAIEPARHGVSREDPNVRHTRSVGLLRSFRFALEGVSYLIRTQRNARIEVAIGFVVVVLAAWLRITGIEWAVLVLAMALVFLGVLPWLIVRASRFNAVNSAHRNVRFDFRAGYGEMSRLLTLPIVLVPLTLGLLYPYYAYRKRRFFLEHSTFGTTPFAFDASAGAYYLVYLKAALMFVLFLAGSAVTLGIGALPFYIWFAAYRDGAVARLTWKSTRLGGLRFDYYYAQIGNSQNSANIFGNTTIPYAAQAITNLSSRAGAIIEPTRAQSYYFSYSTSFNPSLEQLVTTTGTSQPLPPEQNEAFEAGVKYEFLNGNLSVNAAAFQITKTNARSQNTDGTFSATGTVRVKGVRTGVTGRITPEWQVFGGYAYLDGRIIDGIGAGTSGNVPLNTPRDSATLWTTYTFRETYEIGGGATYIGYRYANNTNSVSVPDFTRLDMTAAYRQPAYDVRVNIFNLTNVMYYEQVIASDGGRAVPGSGLTAMLTYTHHL